MRVMLIGGGGREHALAWKLAQSPLLTQLVVVPGNPGIAAEPKTKCLPGNVLDFAGLTKIARDEKIEFVVVGPDNPLAEGVVDHLEHEGFRCFGPTRAAAELEWSKGFTKDLCAANNIPTARYRRFTDAGVARAYVAGHRMPVVIKADGLALGKGVIIAETRAEADDAIDEMFAGKFGDASRSVVVEEFMTGEEASFFALCDGIHALPLVAAQDHKRVGEGDTGPNTGGMGAYSPAPVMTQAMIDRTMAEIIHPTLVAMAKMGRPFKGVFYAGLMITDEGPKLIEYNARFGDPETQVLMMRLESDLLPALIAAREGTLNQVQLKWRAEAALTVAMAAKGYPGDVKKGSVIRGLDGLSGDPTLKIFHAGTARNAQGELTANGGRVLNVTALGKDVREAQARAYAAVDRIDWPEGFCRRDIGWRALSR
ncbi:MAG TPA: phosphoribosylamine--glycine ligase [Micropepsaceae bacterium]|nr:phosphoribosylamine--glycine ligase [Micropepsaceae bacterium]